MPLVIPPGYGLAAIEFTGAAGTPIHVTTIGVSLGQVGGDFTLAADAVFQAYRENFSVGTTSQLTIARCVLAVGSDGPGGAVESSLNPVPGTGSFTPAPVAMAPIARKITNTLGRRGRGRMFLPGLLSNANVDASGSIAGPARSAMQNSVNQFLERLRVGHPGGTGFINVPPTPGYLLHSSAPTTPTPITQLLISPTVGWVRGRIR